MFSGGRPFHARLRLFLVMSELAFSHSESLIARLAVILTLRAAQRMDLHLPFITSELAVKRPELLDGRDRVADMPPKKPNNLLRRIRWITCRAWLICGLGTLATGCGFAVYRSVWLYRSVPTKGIVTSVSEAASEQDQTVNYAPTFTFKAEDGRAYSVTSGVASNPPSFAVGQEVQVRYTKINPESAEIDSFWQLWLVSVVCGGLGIFFAGIGYLLFRHEKRSASVREQFYLRPSGSERFARAFVSGPIPVVLSPMRTRLRGHLRIGSDSPAIC